MQTRIVCQLRWAYVNKLIPASTILSNCDPLRKYAQARIQLSRLQIGSLPIFSSAHSTRPVAQTPVSTPYVWVSWYCCLTLPTCPPCYRISHFLGLVLSNAMCEYEKHELEKLKTDKENLADRCAKIYVIVAVDIFGEKSCIKKQRSCKCTLRSSPSQRALPIFRRDKKFSVEPSRVIWKSDRITLILQVLKISGFS